MNIVFGLFGLYNWVEGQLLAGGSIVGHSNCQTTKYR